MTIAYELYKSMGKRPCPPNSPRVKKCTMVLNENSEDLLTGNLFGLLKYLPPPTWLIPLLETVYKGRDFKHLSHSNVKIEFWRKLPPPHTRYREGISEVDIVITILNLVILVECKYRSPVQQMQMIPLKRNQIIRYLDTAVFNYIPHSNIKSDIYFVLLTDTEGEPDVLSLYRNPEKILEELTRARPFIDYNQISKMLAGNIGWATWRDILAILQKQALKRTGSVEDLIIKDLIQYLQYKLPG
jgi:hypothetical protein